jgi:hypothetical protein
MKRVALVIGAVLLCISLAAPLQSFSSFTGRRGELPQRLGRAKPRRRARGALPAQLDPAWVPGLAIFRNSRLNRASDC